MALPAKMRLYLSSFLLTIACAYAITVDPWTERALSNCYVTIEKNDLEPVDKNMLGRTVYGGMVKPIESVLRTTLPRPSTIDGAKVYSCMLSRYIDELSPRTFMETETNYEYQGRQVTINSYAIPMYYHNNIDDDTTSQGLACWYKKPVNGTNITADATAIQCGGISLPSEIKTRANVYSQALQPVRDRVDMYVNSSYAPPYNESLIESLAYASLDSLALTTIKKETYNLVRSSVGYADIAQGTLCEDCRKLSVTNVKIRLIGDVNNTPPCLEQVSVVPMLYTYSRGANLMHCIGSINGYSLYSMDGRVASVLAVADSNTSLCNPKVDTTVLITPFFSTQYQGFKFVTLNNYDPARYILAKHNTNYSGSELDAMTLTQIPRQAISIVMEGFDKWNTTIVDVTVKTDVAGSLASAGVGLTGKWTVWQSFDFELNYSLVLPTVSREADMGVSSRDQRFDKTNLDFGPNWKNYRDACRTYGQDLFSIRKISDPLDVSEIYLLVDELASNMTQANNREKVINALNSAIAPILVVENGATWSTIIALTIGSIGSVTIVRSEWMPWYLYMLLQCAAIWIPIGTGINTLSKLSGTTGEFMVWDHTWGNGLLLGNTVSSILVHIVKFGSVVEDRILKFAVMLTYATVAQITVVVIAYKYFMQEKRERYGKLNAYAATVTENAVSNVEEANKCDSMQKALR